MEFGHPTLGPNTQFLLLCPSAWSHTDRTTDNSLAEPFQQPSPYKSRPVQHLFTGPKQHAAWHAALSLKFDGKESGKQALGQPHKSNRRIKTQTKKKNFKKKKEPPQKTPNPENSAIPKSDS